MGNHHGGGGRVADPHTQERRHRHESQHDPGTGFGMELPRIVKNEDSKLSSDVYFVLGCELKRLPTALASKLTHHLAASQRW